MRRLLAISLKELRQLRRDRLTLAMMISMPVSELLLLGYAINTDIRHIETVVLDRDRSAASRRLVVQMRSTGYYDVVGAVENYHDIARALRSGRATVGVVVPADFASDLERRRPTRVQLIVDGSDPQIVGTAIDTATGLAAARSAELAAPGVTRSSTRPAAAPLSFEPIIMYNPDQRTAVYIVPGLIGVLLTMTMVMLTAMALTRERERGTLEALIVSPASRLEIVVGKIAPYIAIGYLQMTLILLAGWWFFDVPTAGSLPLLYTVAALFIAAHLALGLLFSTVAQTQQQAMQMSFFFLLPNILITGFVFPFESMPLPVQHLAQALPLTHFLRVARRILLKGAHLEDMNSEVAWLAGIVAVFIASAAIRFKKKLL
ncbi:ABC transporter permease [Nannocystis sp. SCPEA4]|uniref:ABC transporter permease n=1 Tax=Nannocystis sp. SCPEA4 TaxID=2996787 RepID=UPI002270871E|nr:ABC transporter permease [Nannocystis sp. SCPEA4]MCY1060447.1 ABC transporter permease [Nannocystis sp. SCPEA4]